eukprot:23441_1
MMASILQLVVNTYIAAREWDVNNFDLVGKSMKFAGIVLAKCKEFDEKLGIREAIESMINQIQTFEEKHKIRARLSEQKKTLDEKYHVTEYVTKVIENENVQKISKKVNETVTNTMATVEDNLKQIKTFEQNQNSKEVEGKAKQN